jgi:hypothetical protein
VRIIAPSSAVVQLVRAQGTVRGDTILVRTPVHLEASLAMSDVRIESMGAVPIRAEAVLSDGPAQRLGGRGYALLFKAGGREVQPLR